MKRTEHLFSRLSGAEDSELRRLEKYAPDSEERKRRIFERSEQLYAQRPDSGEGSAQTERLEKLEVRRAPAWVTPMRTAAACTAAAVMLGAGFLFLRGAPEPSEGVADGAEQIVVSGKESEREEPSSPEKEAETAAEEASSASSENTSESSAESGAKSENESKTESRAKNKNESKTESGEESAAAQSPSRPEAESSIPPVPMPAVDISSRQDQSEGSGRAVKDPNGDEIDIAPEDPENSEPTAGVCGTQGEEPGEINVQIGVTDSEKVLKITPEMSYAQVIELLGTPNDVLTDSYGQYIVDGDYLLMLEWDYDTDPVLRSGSELLAGCPRISEMLNSPETLTFDCYVVDYNGAAVRVTCPQYSRFDCATVNVHTGENAREWAALIERAMSDGKPLRITHEDYVLESYPPIVTPVSIEIAP